MANRKGDFVGAYLPKEINEFLERRAKIEHSNVSDVLKNILLKEMSEDIVTDSNKIIESDNQEK